MAKKKFPTEIDDTEIININRPDSEAQTDTPSVASPELQPKKETVAAVQTKIESESTKGKVGRPKVKTEPTKTINIAVPVSLMEKVEIAKCKYNNNLTEYINAIIRADIEANMDKYNQLYELLNN